jgi:hypothetical protein
MLSLNLWYLRFWLVLGAITIFGKSGAGAAQFAVSDTFPAIIGIANLLIHARVGLGWSHDQTSPSKATGNSSERAVVWFVPRVFTRRIKNLKKNNYRIVNLGNGNFPMLLPGTKGE